MEKEKKDDRLQILKERIKTEGLDGDLTRVGEILGGVPASTVARVLEKDRYASLTTVKQQNIVNSYLRMLNERRKEEAMLDKELLGS